MYGWERPFLPCVYHWVRHISMRHTSINRPIRRISFREKNLVLTGRRDIKLFGNRVVIITAQFPAQWEAISSYCFCSNVGYSRESRYPCWGGLLIVIVESHWLLSRMGFQSYYVIISLSRLSLGPLIESILCNAHWWHHGSLSQPCSLNYQINHIEYLSIIIVHYFSNQTSPPPLTRYGRLATRSNRGGECFRSLSKQISSRYDRSCTLLCTIILRSPWYWPLVCPHHTRTSGSHQSGKCLGSLSLRGF